MKNISKESNEVFNLIKKFGPIRSTEIVKNLNLSTKNVYKHLSKLLDEDLVKKTGSTPVVFYSVKAVSKNEVVGYDIDNEVIENNYIYVSPSGEMIIGIEGFQEWCRKNQFDFNKERKLLISKIKSFILGIAFASYPTNMIGHISIISPLANCVLARTVNSPFGLLE